MTDYIVEVDDEGEVERIFESFYRGGGLYCLEKKIEASDNNILYNRLAMVQDIVGNIPEGQHIGPKLTICSEGLVIPLVDDKPTKGWKWLLDQPVGTHLTNSGGAKFTVEEDGLFWYERNQKNHLWLWDGTVQNQEGIILPTDWRTRDWVLEASEETCKTWEEPVKLTGWKYLESLPNGTQFRTPKYGDLVTKQKDGVYYTNILLDPSGGTHKGSWDGKIDGVMCLTDWRFQDHVIAWSADTLTIQEPPQ